MKSYLLSLVVLAVILCGGQAYAAHYGMAGCGVGALAFKDEPGKIQILAATLNNIISPQTSAITSGTSNCYEDARSASAMFIQVNEVALRKEIARGNGESLASLSKILSCEDSEKLGRALQAHYGEIFSEQATPAQISDSIHSTIRNDQELAKACSV